MNTALAIAVVVQALALGAVALRLSWPTPPADAGPDVVSGEVVHQDLDYYEDGMRQVGFRPPQS